MAQINKTDYDTKYVQNTGAARFQDNVNGDIGANDMRDYSTDHKDSVMFILDNFIDEDSFASDSATKAPSQQSVKAYVLAHVNGIAWKDTVACATTANITLSGEQTIDGILTSGSRVLVKDQSTQSQNGIYVSATGAWARSTDCDASAEFNNAVVGVTAGTVNAGTFWRQTQTGITVGSSNVIWSAFTVVSQNLSSVLTAGNDGGGAAIENIADPTNAQDAATKNYVDTVSGNAVSEANTAAGNQYLRIGDITNDDNYVEIGEVGSVPTVRSGGNQANGRALIVTGEDGVSNGNGGSLLLDCGAGAGTGVAGGISMFQVASVSVFGGGSKVLYVANASVVPVSNPTGGGILYVEAGALKYRGSSGTVTTIANA